MNFLKNKYTQEIAEVESYEILEARGRIPYYPSHNSKNQIGYLVSEWEPISSNDECVKEYIIRKLMKEMGY